MPAGRTFAVFFFLFFFLVNCLQAQLCAGSLGDPVVNINFGNGQDASNSGYSPTNAYSYTSSSCPNDGSYTIARSTSGCFNNSWHTVNSDHTGNGAFMLVNASYEPGDFFVATVSDLCPNTTYEFAAWIVNVLNRSGIRPNISFSIEAPDGSKLAEYSTGDIPETSSAQWKQYGFYFNTPLNNPVIILRMTNNAPGGIGNDIGLDDITFRPCGAKITASIDNFTVDTIHRCEGAPSSYNFKGIASSAYQNPVFHWQQSIDSGASWSDIPGAQSDRYGFTATGEPRLYLYRFSATDAAVQNISSCRISSNVLAVYVHPDPELDAGPDKVYIDGFPVRLDGSLSGEAPLFSWSPETYLNDPQQLQPLSSPSADIRYELYARSAFGCESRDSVSVQVVEGIFVPSAFTPNGDGRNDHWHIPYLLPEFDAETSVFNRWGKLVYQTRGSIVDWDGRFRGQLLPSGVYVYSIRFNKLKLPAMKGTVTLIR